MSRSRSPEPRGAEKSAPGGDNARSDRRQSRSRSRSRDRGGGRDRRDDRPSSRVYVGNLPGDVSKRELDDLFYKYGKIKDIAIPRSERGPAFAFVEYYDARDADDAVYYRRDYKFDGARLKVELSKRRPDRNDRGERGGRDGRERNPREDRERRAPNRSEFGLIIKNIDNRCSWQTLKDHMRGEGKSQFKVTFSNMDKSNGIGEVEYETQEDMEDALKALDGTSLERYPDDKLEISARPAQEKAPERESESAAVEMDAPKEQDNENVDAEKQERGASED